MHWLAPAMVLTAAGAPRAHHSNRLLCLGNTFTLRRLAEHGPVGPAGIALAAYANVRATIRRDLVGTARLLGAAEYWDQLLPNPTQGHRSALFRSLVKSWLTQRRGVLEPLERAAELAREMGDLE